MIKEIVLRNARRQIGRSVWDSVWYEAEKTEVYATVFTDIRNAVIRGILDANEIGRHYPLTLRFLPFLTDEIS